MEVIPTKIPGVLLIRPRVFTDERGAFAETYQHARYAAAGMNAHFVQDNFSRSHQGVLRGLHYQVDEPQGKLIWVVRGEIFDAVVDLRRSSPTFGQSFTVALRSESFEQLFVPPGLAHGFYVLSDGAEVTYKCTAPYAPAHERTLFWNDPALGIAWPSSSPLLSEKDRRGLSYSEAPKYESL